MHLQVNALQVSRLQTSVEVEGWNFKRSDDLRSACPDEEIRLTAGAEPDREFERREIVNYGSRTYNEVEVLQCL